MTRLVIIDSGGANIASVRYAIDRLHVNAELTTDAQRIRNATHVILPGVGAAADCMRRLEQANLIDTLTQLKQPFLGLCVGMQLLFASSAEGDVACLNLIPGRVQRIVHQPGFPVPHMGWNTLNLKQASPLLQDFTANDYVYYVHSFAAPLVEGTLATTEYGKEFTAVVQYENYFGVQFHPERSARAGALLLENFLKID